MTPFDVSVPTRLVFGRGTLRTLADCVKSVGGSSVFLVTDPGLVAAGHVERAESLLASANIPFRRFDRVPEDPDANDVAAAAAFFSEQPMDVFVGLGGGSCIDVAKGCAFVLAGGGTMEDYWGRGKARGRLLPILAVPTTAGTGSEVQSFALIEQPLTGRKMACGDPRAAPRVAILDPELTLTLPPLVTACTALDAIGHAVETAVTSVRTAWSMSWSIAAFEALVPALPRVLEDPSDVESRAQLLLGAAFAGLAIESSMLGAAHALANALTARQPLAHGHAVALALPAVVRFNAQDPVCATIYRQLGSRVGWRPGEGEPRVAQWISEMTARCGLSAGLDAVGVRSTDWEELAALAAQQWTGEFNPRPLDRAAWLQILEDAR